MLIDLSDYYTLEKASWWRGHNGDIMYTIELVSKSTGEIMDWTFDEPRFDKLLKQMEKNVKMKERLLKRKRLDYVQS